MLLHFDVTYRFMEVAEGTIPLSMYQFIMSPVFNVTGGENVALQVSTPFTNFIVHLLVGLMVPLTTRLTVLSTKLGIGGLVMLVKVLTSIFVIVHEPGIISWAATYPLNPEICWMAVPEPHGKTQ